MTVIEEEKEEEEKADTYQKQNYCVTELRRHFFQLAIASSKSTTAVL